MFPHPLLTLNPALGVSKRALAGTAVGFDRTIARVVLLRTATLPKFNAAGVAVSVDREAVVTAMPTPVSGTLSGDAGSVLLMVSVPVKTPAAAGAYVTLTAHEDAAFSVVMPHVLLTEKPGVVEKARPSTAWLPMFASVSERALVLPATMLPKFNEPGTTDSCGSVPIPESATVSGTCDAEVTTDSTLRHVPVPAGVNTLAMVQLLPGATVPPAAGHAPMPCGETVSANAVSPIVATDAIVIGSVPVFARVATCNVL